MSATNFVDGVLSAKHVQLSEKGASSKNLTWHLDSGFSCCICRAKNSAVMSAG